MPVMWESQPPPGTRIPADDALHYPASGNSKRIIPPQVSEFITLIKDSSLLSTIGVVELLQSAKTIGTYTYNYVPPLLMASVVYLALTLTISRFSSKLEERMALSD